MTLLISRSLKHKSGNGISIFIDRFPWSPIRLFCIYVNARAFDDARIALHGVMGARAAPPKVTDVQDLMRERLQGTCAAALDVLKSS